MKTSVILQKINWRHPKYLLPLVLFPILIFLGYTVVDIFEFETAETEESKLSVTEGSINTDMPEINKGNSEIKNKYQSMLDGFGKVTDYSGTADIEREEEKQAFEFQSAYNEEQKQRMDSLMQVQAEEAERIREMLEAQKTANANESNVKSAAEAMKDERIKDKDNEMQELARQIEMVQRVAKGEKILTEEEKEEQRQMQLRREEQKRVNDSIALANAPKAVTKAADSDERYFNTVSDDEQNPKLIRARVDEMVKVKDGSRLRIRLSEDVEIDGELLRKGSYLYATVTGFNAQRVNAEVSSVMLGQEIKKVKLTVYDLDCMKGFYVPSSDFRDLSKELGAGAMNMNVNMNSSSGEQSLESVAMQTLQQAFQSTTQAFGNQIRKNRARIKYNTEIYLVDESN